MIRWLASLCCRHVWEVRSTVVAVPLTKLGACEGFDVDEIERLMKGATRTLCTCSKCGDIRTFVQTGTPCDS